MKKEQEINYKESIEELKEKLEEGVRNVITSSDNFAEWLRVQSRFRKYSFLNTLLIWYQNPNATYVAGFQQWKKFERNVKKGEKALKIWAPIIKKESKEDELSNELKEYVLKGFKRTNVFDISQTEGKPLPEICVDEKLTCKNAEDNYKLLSANMNELKIKEVESIPGYPNAKGCYFPNKKVIFIKQDLSSNYKFSTLCHEISHYMVNVGIESGELNIKEFSEAAEGFKSMTAVEEVLVESVAYVTCQFYNIDTKTKTFEYVATWSGCDSQKVKKLGFLIQKYSNKLIQRIEDLREKEGLKAVS